MTAREMHIELEFSLSKLGANKTRAYLPEELDWVLNKMQERFVQEKLRPKEKGFFAYDQLEVDAIKPLIKKEEIKDFHISKNNDYDIYSCLLPNDYSYLVDKRVIVERTCNGDKVQKSTPGRVESSAIISKMLYTPFYDSTFLSPVLEIVGKNINIYAKNFLIRSLELTYIKKIKKIKLDLSSDAMSSSCELPEEFHQTLCDLATEYLKGRIGNIQEQQAIIADNKLRVTL